MRRSGTVAANRSSILAGSPEPDSVAGHTHPEEAVRTGVATQAALGGRDGLLLEQIGEGWLPMGMARRAE
jgi:hypothetical protein